MQVFEQTKKYSCRDPAAYIEKCIISPYKYAMFYHGDNEDDYLFGASVAVAFSNDLSNWYE